MIPFNKPTRTGSEEAYIFDALNSNKLSGDGLYTRLCEDWFTQNLKCERALFTPSCTHALELAALLLDIKQDDEIIMPSFTFVSTANAFVLRGAKIIFVDIRPDTMNINEELIKDAITPNTKAIIVVHYAGVSCAIDEILDIALKFKIPLIEDSAQGINAFYKGKPLGSFGHMSTFSFHETKNITSGGEGGLLVINNSIYTDRAEIIREKGTNRSLFFRGMVDKYTWVDIGSSYLPSELQAAYLWGQIEAMDEITRNRINIWNYYLEHLSILVLNGFIELPKIPDDCTHNGHIFYIKCKNLHERSKLITKLQNDGVQAVFHYVPLHTSPGGIRYGKFKGQDVYTTIESERILRLPLWYDMKESDAAKIVTLVKDFYLK